MQGHHLLTGVLLQWEMRQPTGGRLKSSSHLSPFCLEVRKLVESGIYLAVAILTLDTDPIVKGGSVAERKALEKITTIEGGSGLELSDQFVTCKTLCLCCPYCCLNTVQIKRKIRCRRSK
jgi:hypothetical protein